MTDRDACGGEYDHAVYGMCPISIVGTRPPPSPLLTDKERARYERLPLKPRWPTKTVGTIPHDCEGGAGCAFPDLAHVKK